ncbi:Emopamil-binding protein [Viridothelium virens]|uniref:Emopamil-binding protein n=1 Tax=Viridothelium virens TaxID=1048519 RepID=A0A6A6HCI6_VIRVR|nr:Emopamil-binding protein [Viridothelium virens]
MASTDSGIIIDSTTILSLLSTLAILTTAYLLSVRLLPAVNTPPQIRILFIWHAFDALIHTLLEGSFLYNCFFTYLALPAPLEDVSISHPASWHGRAWNDAIATGHKLLTPPGVYFLGRSDRLYGSFYGINPMSALWREYAKADARWGGADLTVVSLELLTVGIGAPLAAYICYLCVKGDQRVWIWAGWLAVGELYGGFMTFAPEWLSGNTNLDGSNFMFMWVYLFFFNMLWVFIPFWILYEAYGTLGRAMITRKSQTLVDEKGKRKD